MLNQKSATILLCLISVVQSTHFLSAQGKKDTVLVTDATPPAWGEGGGEGAAILPENIQMDSENIKDSSFAILPENAVALSGKLKVKGKGKNAQFSLKTKDKTYNLTLVNGSTDAFYALKNKNISVRGVKSSKEDAFLVFEYAIMP